KSQLEIVSTDYRPVAEIIFAKVKGVQKENLTVDMEDFITVKGIKALGNQLTSDKVKQVSLMEPLPYEVAEETPADELEVNDAKNVSDEDLDIDENGQTLLF